MYLNGFRVREDLQNESGNALIDLRGDTTPSEY
jgi:hypothetical protein